MKNKTHMFLSHFLQEKTYLPISDLLTGNSVYNKLKFLNKSQFWSREHIESFQNKRLKILINNAYHYVPYYHDLFDSLNLTPNDIQMKNDLAKLPVLTKSIIKKEGIDRFTSRNVPNNKRVKSSSSGSTGEPLSYFRTKEAYSMNIAANLRGWYWMGFRLGDKYIKLSQNPRKNPMKRLQDKMSNNLYLATSPLIDETFAFILSQVEDYKPKVIRCYPDPLLFLARYKKLHPEYKFSPRAITTTGNTLFAETRNEIEEAFDCRIFDSYACEGNSMVFECPTHTCYHSTEEYGISEIIDEDGNLLLEGVGRLISTDLWNLAHPFIRYDTQDLVEINSKPCECGRKHLKITRILGRENEVLELPKGKFIVHDFTIFFSRQDLPTFGAIDQFQVVDSIDRVIFKLVVNNLFKPDVSTFIKNYWEKEMQKKVEVEIVKNVPLTISGKRRFVLIE